MHKLVKGVINFHQNVLPSIKAQFAELALGQKPDALMIACSDSRVAPNLFASTDPGDLFVVRNPGNLIPPARTDAANPESEACAIEIALETLRVGDIIVCGHSHCAGIHALLNDDSATPHAKHWIRHAQAAKRAHRAGKILDAAFSSEDQLSQLNVLCQIDNLKTYPPVRARLDDGTLRLHAWWFDIASGNVYAFEADKNKFVVIDAEEGEAILRRLKN